ncbi:SGF29 tudor-like domain-containing protein [Flagelloscypha sp. PMI_526]|nr:SGF29 tudor-like domain-containing protein [Flagelloscypha sp. PMI_526]
MADRRRGGSARPATLEEIDIWSHAVTELNNLKSHYDKPPELVVERFNRVLRAWPPEADEDAGTESYESMKDLTSKLHTALNELQDYSLHEQSALDRAIDKLELLIALRQAPGENIPQDNKRKRRSSPPSASMPIPMVVDSLPPTALSRQQTPTAPLARAESMPKVKLKLPPTATSSAPSSTIVPHTGSDPKSRKKRYQDQLPYSSGRKVAYHIKASTQNQALPDDSAEWILAIIHDCIQQDKNRYNVRDADDGKLYPTTTKSIIPLPDPTAAPGAFESLERYMKFPARSTVMALYPDTTSFYRAEVINGIHPLPPPNGAPHYTLKFEDDGETSHEIQAHLVVEWPRQ